MQMYADAGNLPLEVVETRQSGCRAAALCAAVGARVRRVRGSDRRRAAQTALLLSRDRRPSAPARQQARYLAVAQALSEVTDAND